jgi:hypothetical protein
VPGSPGADNPGPEGTKADARLDGPRTGRVDPAVRFPDRPREWRDLELPPDAPSAWHQPGIKDHPDRPPPDAIRLPPERLAHILDGDELGRGGHLHGTGFPGKTEFSPDWDEDRIAAAVLHTAYRPQLVERQEHGPWLVRRTHDRVDVWTVVHEDGRIWTAYPDPGSPGITRNPRARDT